MSCTSRSFNVITAGSSPLSYPAVTWMDLFPSDALRIPYDFVTFSGKDAGYSLFFFFCCFKFSSFSSSHQDLGLRLLTRTLF